MANLIITRGHAVGRRIYLKDFPITIGRDMANVVVIEDEEASREHCHIKKRGRLFVLEDLESKNGCFINGDRTLNSVLKNGDKILLGNTEFLFTSALEVAIDVQVQDFLPASVGSVAGIDGTGFVEERMHQSYFVHDRADGQDGQVVRINTNQLTNKTQEDLVGVKKIHDLQADVFIASSFEEAAASVLRGLGQISSKISRGLFWGIVGEGSNLIPVAKRHFRNLILPFDFSQKALSDALSRRCGVLIKCIEKHRVVLPVVYEMNMVGVVHLECDDSVYPLEEHEIELMQVFLSRISFFLETQLLRREIDTWVMGSLDALVTAIDAKDTYTLGHSERVCRYSLAIADALKVNKETKKILMISAFCHDVGKIGIPDAILKKAASLSSEEYDEMKTHPKIGADIVSHLPNAKQILSGVKHHHEKWDGTGYPDGLEADEIPFFGRIIAVADVFDAMVSGRSYSGFLNEEEAIEKIQNEVELFDPTIVKALVQAWHHGAITQRTSTEGKGHGTEKFTP